MAHLIVIVANRWDESSQALASCWKSHDARVLTPRDLSRAGWRHRLGQPARCTAVIDGEVVPQGAIAGVLTRMPCVFEQELTHIAPGDRTYIAAEMNAFLLYWLASLSCPVVNRPTPGCLTGPSWRPEKWTQFAVEAGFVVEAMHLRTSVQQSAILDESSAIVAGDQYFGEPAVQVQAQRLAALAGVELLAVRLCTGASGGPRFLGVNLVPDLCDDNVAAAVLEALEQIPAAIG